MIALANFLSIGFSVRVAHSYILRALGIICLIILFCMASVNYNQFHQTDVYVSENLSFDNFRQIGMHYHLGTVPGTLGKKPRVWFEVPETLPGA